MSTLLDFVLKRRFHFALPHSPFTLLVVVVAAWLSLPRSFVIGDSA